MSFNTVTQKVGAFAHDRERDRRRHIIHKATKSALLRII